MTMVRTITASAYLFGLALASPLAAQEQTPSAEPQATISDVQRSALRALPTNLFGLACLSQTADQNADLRICIPRDIRRGPIVGVTSYFGGRDLSYEELSQQMRESFHESRSFRVISEQPFTVPSMPGAVGMRGVYQADTGRKFTWSISYLGNLTRVLITAPNSATSQQFEGELIEKVFGPDRYIPVTSESGNQ